MREKELTGYASQDKPWQKYYTEEALNGEIAQCKIYDYLWSVNARFMIICGLPIRIILMESQSFILGIKYLLKTFFVTSSPQQKRLFQQV